MVRDHAFDEIDVGIAGIGGHVGHHGVHRGGIAFDGCVVGQFRRDHGSVAHHGHAIGSHVHA